MKVCYINLDSATDRRDFIEDNFRRHNSHGWALERVPAAGKDRLAQSPYAFSQLRDAQISCFLSHLDTIHRHADAGEDLMIVEDDVKFGPRSQELIKTVVENAPRDKWDIIFTDLYFTSVQSMLGLFEMKRQLNGGFRLLDLAMFPFSLSAIPFAGSSAYVVNGDRIGGIAKRMSPAGMVNLPYDLYLGKLIAEKAIAVHAIFPFATTLSPFAESSQIQPDDSAIRDALWNAWRRLVWYESDGSEAENSLGRVEGFFHDKLAEIMSRIVKGLISNREA